MTDPRINECRRVVSALDAQLVHLSPRAQHEQLRSLAARRHALAQFLAGQGIHVPAPPVHW